MANLNSNAPSRAFEAGAVLTINDGTDTVTILATEPGTLEWEPGLYEIKDWKDRGVLQTPYEGDERPTKFKIRIKYSGVQASGDVYKYITERGANGAIKLFTVVLKIPANRAAITGEQITFASCFLNEGGCKIKAGMKFDTLELEMTDNEVKPTPTTY